MKTYIKRIFQFLLPVLSLFLLVILSINYYVLSFSDKGIFIDVKELPIVTVGLVFGASVKKDGTPSDILKDRLDVAVQAYKLKKIQTIIVSGDNSHLSYNEPAGMEKYLIQQGIPKNNIYLDYAGFDTFDSIYRLKHIFGVERIILFSQDFHLTRAMYISTKLGIQSYGISTSIRTYYNQSYNNRREIFARIKAFWDADINNSKPRFLGEPIDITIPQNKSDA